MKLHSLGMEKYRSFENCRLSFDDRLTVLVGPNGSGKTSVLDAAATILKGVSGRSYAHTFDALPLRDVYLKSVQQEITLSFQLQFFEDLFPLSVLFSRRHGDKLDASVNWTQESQGYVRAGEAEVRAQGYTLFAYYGAKRVLPQDNKEHNTARKAVESTLDSAFSHTADVTIDFAASLAWFDTKDAQEAREARTRQNLRYAIPELQAVRDAISKALQDYENPHMAGTPAELVIYKKGDSATAYTLMQLSDGYRTMLALIMDLARRMAVANSSQYAAQGKSVLESPAIVLIDEVELHLHPAWQQRVLASLLDIFPKAQFIVTTHSPQVLTSIEPQHIRILEKGQARPVTSASYGAESSRVLEDILGVSPRPAGNEAKKMLDSYLQLVNAKQHTSPEARDYRKQLDIWMAGDPVLDHADMLIGRAERQKAREESRA